MVKEAIYVDIPQTILWGVEQTGTRCNDINHWRWEESQGILNNWHIWFCQLEQSPWIWLCIKAAIVAIVAYTLATSSSWTPTAVDQVLIGQMKYPWWQDLTYDVRHVWHTIVLRGLYVTSDVPLFDVTWTITYVWCTMYPCSTKSGLYPSNPGWSHPYTTYSFCGVCLYCSQSPCTLWAHYIACVKFAHPRCPWKHSRGQSWSLQISMVAILEMFTTVP